MESRDALSALDAKPVSVATPTGLGVRQARARILLTSIWCLASCAISAFEWEADAAPTPVHQLLCPTPCSCSILVLPWPPLFAPLFSPRQHLVPPTHPARRLHGRLFNDRARMQDEHARLCDGHRAWQARSPAGRGQFDQGRWQARRDSNDPDTGFMLV